MTDEIHFLSHFRHGLSAVASRDPLLSGGDGAQQKADRSARLSFYVVALFHALAEDERMGKADERVHDQTGGGMRIDRLELAGLDAIAQDQFGDAVNDLLVSSDGLPAVLDRGQ